MHPLRQRHFRGWLSFAGRLGFVPKHGRPLASREAVFAVVTTSYPGWTQLSVVARFASSLVNKTCWIGQRGRCKPRVPGHWEKEGPASPQ